MSKNFHDNNEFAALKLILTLGFVCACLMLLTSCTTNEKADEKACYVECKKCEEVKLSCTGKKQHDTSEVTPTAVN